MSCLPTPYPSAEAEQPTTVWLLHGEGEEYQALLDHLQTITATTEGQVGMFWASLELTDHGAGRESCADGQVIFGGCLLAVANGYVSQLVGRVQ